MKILRNPEVRDRTGLSRSTVYRLIEEGSFPRQVKLGARSAGWIESEVDAWLERRIQESRQDTAEERHGLSVVAEQVLTLYGLEKKRTQTRAEPQERPAMPRAQAREYQGSGSVPRAPERPAERAAVAAGDAFGDMVDDLP